MCPPGYHHSGFVATHALQHMMFSSCAQVHELPQNCCGDNREGTLYILSIHIYIGAHWEQKEHWNLSNPPPHPTPTGSRGGAHGNFSKIYLWDHLELALSAPKFQSINH